MAKEALVDEMDKAEAGVLGSSDETPDQTILIGYE